MEGGDCNMVAKENKDAPNLQRLAQSVSPAPGDGQAQALPRRMPHLHKLEK
jgi:hypothetical protein